MGGRKPAKVRSPYWRPFEHDGACRCADCSGTRCALYAVAVALGAVIAAAGFLS